MTSSSRHSHYRDTGAGRHVRHSITDDIDALIGDYRAWQTESEKRERGRRSSAGTLVVDWDGTEYGQAFFRNSGRNSSPAPLHEGSNTASSSTTSRATTSTASRAPSSATSRAPCSTTSRTPSSKASRAPPTYATSTTASSAKSKQSKPKQRVDSLFDSVTSTSYPRYTDTEHFIPKAPPRTSSTDVTFHRYDDVDAGKYAHADISVAYSPTTNTARGHDPATQLNYAYNGRTMHVHKETQHSRQRPGETPRTPQLNAFFDVPVDKYRSKASADRHTTPSSSSSAHIEFQQHGSLPPLPSHQKRTARSFVKRVLSKLDSSGVLGKMRKEREEMRKTEAWVKEGYRT